MQVWGSLPLTPPKALERRDLSGVPTPKDIWRQAGKKETETTECSFSVPLSLWEPLW